MTLRQEVLLRKYLTDNQIEELKRERYDVISDFIGMIISTSNYDFNKEVSIDKSIAEKLETYVNENIEKYTRITDEKCRCTNMYVIKGFDIKVFKFQQKWFKGMSNSPSYNWFFILEDGSRYSGVYQILFNNKIKNINQLLELLYEYKHDKC